MLELFALIAVTLLLNAVLIGVLVWAYRAPRLASHRIHAGPGMQVPWPHRMRVTAVSSALSLAYIFGFVYLAFDAVFTTAETAWWVVLVQAVGSLLLYDFIYYFAHRAMHHPRALRFVHGVHHRARNPSALESFYLHPAELVLGLSLFFFATWAIGPVHVHAFALAFFVYSHANVLVHSGIDTKAALFFPIDFLARKHHVHHLVDPGKNFSNLTPLPDLLFRTSS